MMFSGKVALITGGNSGIGRALMQVLAGNGLKAATLLDIKEDKDFINELKEDHKDCQVQFLKTDVTRCSEVNEAFQKACEKFNQLDIVVNNAGIIDEVNPEKQMKTNFNAAMNGTVLAMENYLPKYTAGDAVIMNVASVFGLTQVECMPYYSISKQATIAIGRTLGTDLNFQRTGVRIVTSCPGVTETPLLAQFDSIRKHYEPVMLDFAGMYRQSTCFCAEEIAKLLNNAPNGTTWVVEKDKAAFQVCFNPITANYTFSPS